MPEKDTEKEPATRKKPEAPPKESGEKTPQGQPAKEPIPPKKKGEMPPDLAEPVVGEPETSESE